jgi:hypothetical protein
MAREGRHVGESLDFSYTITRSYKVMHIQRFESEEPIGSNARKKDFNRISRLVSLRWEETI